MAALLFVFALPAVMALTPQKMPRSQRHESRREIDDLERVWVDALLHGNVNALESLLDDDYIAITPFGTLQSRDEALTTLRSGLMRFSSIELSDRKVRFYGQTAVVTSRAEVAGTAGDRSISGSFRYTRVYVRDSRGKWKIVSFEASRIRDDAEHDHK